jgi:hypothetical protein
VSVCQCMTDLEPFVPNKALDEAERIKCGVMQRGDECKEKGEGRTYILYMQGGS